MIYFKATNIFRCETYKYDGTPMKTNNRKTCKEVCDRVASEEPWFGIEQEYTLLDMDSRPLGWPKLGFPGPQGPCKNSFHNYTTISLRKYFLNRLLWSWSRQSNCSRCCRCTLSCMLICWSKNLRYKC